MPKQSKIDALVDYFKLCPLLKEGVMGVDYLEDKHTLGIFIRLFNVI